MKALRNVLVLSAALLLPGGCTAFRTGARVPFVTTPMEVVDRMLELAEVNKDDVVYDIGSGDGRIVIRAAKRYGARGVGIEIDADLVERSREKAKQEEVDHLVEFREQDALTVDVSPASVVTIYMLPEFNNQLRPIFEKQLKPGSRVVAHDFGISEWVPDKVETMAGGILHDHKIFLWRVK